MRATSSVLAAGAQANFFNTPAREEHGFPLYSLTMPTVATRMSPVRDAGPRSVLIDRGALNFRDRRCRGHGDGAAGSMADMINGHGMPEGIANLAVDRASVEVVDLGQVVLNGFSDRAHEYAGKVLQERGVKLALGAGVKEVAADHVLLSDGTTIKTRCVAWAGGLKAAAPAAASGLPLGRGGRIDVGPDLTVEGIPRRVRHR